VWLGGIDWRAVIAGVPHGRDVDYFIGYPFFNDTLGNITGIVPEQTDWTYIDRNISEFMQDTWMNFTKYGFDWLIACCWCLLHVPMLTTIIMFVSTCLSLLHFLHSLVFHYKLKVTFLVNPFHYRSLTVDTPDWCSWLMRPFSVSTLLFSFSSWFDAVD